MIKALIKKPLFWFGFLYIFLWLAGSILYMWLGHDYIPKGELKWNSQNVLVGRPPYAPWENPPLGIDGFVDNIFFVLLVGAKFTLGFALLIAILRLVISCIIGVIMRLYIPKIGSAVLTPFENISYFPFALLAYLILKWSLFDDGLDLHFTHSFGFRVWMDVIVLTIIAVPATTRTIFSETGNILNSEFINSARVLGGGRLHLFWTHIRPFLTPQIFLVFTREIIQTLLLMAHLGVLNVAIGGIMMKHNMFDPPHKPPSPYVLSHDWSGLIGIWWQYIWSSVPWMPFIPIIAIMLAIFSAKAILISIEKVIGPGHGSSSRGL